MRRHAGGMEGLPDWVPPPVRHYLEHVEGGAPIRVLARRSEVHASTVLRQVRQMESRRDDPLVDAALQRLSRRYGPASPEERAMTHHDPQGPRPDGGDTGAMAETMRVLRRMAEPGAVLAVASGMPVAAVMREGPAGETQRLARLDRSVAETLALRGWIAAQEGPGKVARYRITSRGRAALKGNDAPGPDGFAEAATGFAAPAATARMAAQDGPLMLLARRRDRDGRPFLGRDLVSAGERLREDFELAQIGPRVTQDWSRFLTAGCASGPGHRPSGARDRLAAALADLGPGLGDVALRCCCYLEGMESLERRMGWSARSGKIVLRIALQRLRRHYDAAGGSEMIG
ncbi:DUF6456 domain-containing protein [Limimaricola hongkongensis]|nr:DUF6456 domain-containing protein [Limimaricola hongkongensis]